MDFVLVSNLNDFFNSSFEKYLSLVCDMQTDCPEHAECMEDSGDYTCKCKKGFIEDDGDCIGKDYY